MRGCSHCSHQLRQSPTQPRIVWGWGLGAGTGAAGPAPEGLEPRLTNIPSGRPQQRRAQDPDEPKKQRTWSEAPVSRRFTFSKPVSEGPIRENAFESGYREPKLGGIACSRPKALELLDYHRLR